MLQVLLFYFILFLRFPFCTISDCRANLQISDEANSVIHILLLISAQVEENNAIIVHPKFAVIFYYVWSLSKTIKL